MYVWRRRCFLRRCALLRTFRVLLFLRPVLGFHRIHFFLGRNIYNADHIVENVDVLMPLAVNLFGRLDFNP